MKIAIVENEMIHTKHLQEQIQRWSQQSQTSVNIEEFLNGEALLLSPFLEFDLVFLDIQMDGMDGISVAHKIREQDFKGEIVFLTSFSEYVFDGYGVKALNYLIKPAPYEKIANCLEQLVKTLYGGAYSFQFKGTFFHVPYSSILYFASANHYLQIITDECDYRQVGSLRSISSSLPSQFMFCHRTLIVNMDHVTKLKGKELVLSNNDTIPVSNSYIQELRSAIFTSADKFR